MDEIEIEIHTIPESVTSQDLYVRKLIKNRFQG